MRTDENGKVIYNTTEKEIMNVAAGHLMVDLERVSHKSSFQEDLGADSLDHVELIMEFEERFDCEVENEDAEKMLTVKDVFDYCDKHGISV